MFDVKCEMEIKYHILYDKELCWSYLYIKLIINHIY